MSRIAISILSLRRYNHLCLSLESLERNAESDAVTFFLIQDGGLNPISGRRYASDSEVDACVEVFNCSGLPHKKVVRQPYNVGIGGGVFVGYSAPFDQGYDFVAVLPNDMIASRYYVRTLRVLSEQFGNDRRAGLLKMYPAPCEEWDRLAQFESKVAYGFSPVVGVGADQGTWRWCWDLCRERVSQWHDEAIRHDYKKLLDGVRTGESIPTGLRDSIIATGGTLWGEGWMEAAARQIGCLGIHTLSPRLMHIGGAGSYLMTTDEMATVVGPLDEVMRSFEMIDLGNVERYERIS